jgi:hypothetical protein
MIPYHHLGVTECHACKKRLEYDVTLCKKKPRLHPECKAARLAAREAARREQVKQRNADCKPDLLEKLAVRSYAEVGEMVGLSAERVRNIEQAALQKLRNKFAALKATMLLHCDETEAF